MVAKKSVESRRMVWVAWIGLAGAFLLPCAGCVPPGGDNANTNPNDNEPACVVDEDCAEGQVCTTGECVTPVAACDTQPDCVLGQNCVDGACADAAGPDVEYGQANSGAYAKVAEGGEVQVFHGSQGGIHTFLSMRFSGFPEETTFSFVRRIVLTDSGEEILPEATIPLNFVSQLEDGTYEVLDYFEFLVGVPGDADGREATVTITVFDRDDPSVSATIEQTVVLVEVDE